MKVITLDAAYTARLEESVGSIEPGKFADFTVLDANPYTVKPETINQINIHATVYRGATANIALSNAGMASDSNTLLLLTQLNQHDHHGHPHAGDVCETSLFLQKVLSEKLN